MSKIFVSGLANIETTCSIDKFPVEYAPVHYNFFGVNSSVAGVGYNVAKALSVLGNDVSVASMIGSDISGESIIKEMQCAGIKTDYVNASLTSSPSSVVLYDKCGKRRIYCDLKDVQEKEYDFSGIKISDYDLVAACNINYSRSLLHIAKDAGVVIATDVHVLSDVFDEYNKEFMEYADILFLSDENIGADHESFIRQIASVYNNKIIVLGRGSRGALMYIRKNNEFYYQDACKVDNIVNTVGAGDALFSSFISLYAAGCSPKECLSLAQKFAAKKITFDGASKGFSTMEELLKL